MSIESSKARIMEYMRTHRRAPALEICAVVGGLGGKQKCIPIGEFEEALRSLERDGLIQINDAAGIRDSRSTPLYRQIVERPSRIDGLAVAAIAAAAIFAVGMIIAFNKIGG